jgi:hypothetical protein
LVGPAGTGKSHLLIGLGLAAVQAGHRVRYFTAADLVETLYRGLADNSVVIDGVLRADLVLLDELGFAPLDPTCGQLLSASSPPPTSGAVWASPATGPSMSGVTSYPIRAPRSP